jgi:hypothetical protein
MRADVRRAIEGRELCDRLDAFTQRVCDWNGCVMPHDCAGNSVPMQVAEQCEDAREVGDSLLSVPLLGALLTKMFG